MKCYQRTQKRSQGLLGIQCFFEWFFQTQKVFRLKTNFLLRAYFLHIVQEKTKS